jgi:exonuclease III
MIFANCNGLRSFIRKGGLDQLLDTLPQNGDVTISLQEIKMKGAVEPQLLKREDTKETTKRLIAAFPYRFYNPMEDAGGHGTAIFTTIKPVQDPITTTGDKATDNEGRTLALVFPEFVLVNTYCPCAGMRRENNKKRRDYMHKVTELLLALTKDGRETDAPRPVIWGGDKNAIKSDDDGHRACLGNPGCNPEEHE